MPCLNATQEIANASCSKTERWHDIASSYLMQSKWRRNGGFISQSKRFSIHHKKHVLAASMTRIAVQDCKHSGIQAGVVLSHSGPRFLEIGPSHP